MDKRTGTKRSAWMIRIMLGLLQLLWVPISQGHPSSITSSGLNTHVFHVAGQPNYDVTGGTRPGNGTNLFHSFGDFSVGAHHIANFHNDSGLATSNILGRVTGGNPSIIFGTIQTTGFGNANLFLMNPAGIVFGPHASLNVGGSVTFTTADYLKLTDGVRFKAMPNAVADTLLSSAAVAAFGFLGSNPGAITIQGSQLSVADGKSLALVGGDIRMTNGTLKAPSGQVQLASLAGRGEAILNPTSGQPGLTVNPHARMGSITLNSTVANPPPLIDTSGKSGGAIVIRGGHLVLNSATITASTIIEEVDIGAGGPIDVRAEQVTLRDSQIRSEGLRFNDGGAIQVNAKQVMLKDSRISNGSEAGRGGAIRVDAKQVMLKDSRISSGSGGGRGGEIRVDAKQVMLKDSEIISAGFDSGGAIRVDAKRVMLKDSEIISASVDGVGGPIDVRAEQVTLRDSQISIEGLPGHGGAIRVDAKRVMLRGSRISSGSGGVQSLIEVDAQDVTLRDSEIFGSSAIRVDAERVTLKDSQIRSFRFESGGTIRVDAAQVMLRDSQIRSESFGGNGGTIDVDAKDMTLRHSQIISTSLVGDGGTINVSAKHLTLRDSQLTTSVSGGPETVGGKITVDAKDVTLRNSQILSTATDGQGGTINIRSHVLHRDARSVIDASSVSGTDGTVTIEPRH